MSAMARLHPVVKSELLCAECDELIRERIDGPCRCCGEARGAQVFDHKYLHPYEHVDLELCGCLHDMDLHGGMICYGCLASHDLVLTAWHTPVLASQTLDHEPW